jgi:ribose/xylose/arabinose/galactoside ABC-type transport system permease subunit
MIAGWLQRYATLATTALVCLLLYLVAGSLYAGFFSPRVFVGFFADNAFLGIVAVGMTFVILSGGIDLSVGAMIGCSSIVIATLVEQAGWHPLPAVLLMLVLGVLFGASMGSLIHFFTLPPFIVTLAGMFFARGMGFVVHEESIAIRHEFYPALNDLPSTVATWLHLPEGGVQFVGHYVPLTAVIFLLVLAVGIYLAHWTRFGRNTYAIGGDEDSAVLMGLPVGRTKVQAYALNGFCSALAGAVYTLYTFSGNPTAGTMLELDAIAAVVIGGTLLTGGAGYVAGTLLGVLIFGIIQTAIIFDGTLSSWWTRIAIGFLVMVFILLQRFFQRTLGSSHCRPS